jgi:hypothetical protein
VQTLPLAWRPFQDQPRRMRRNAFDDIAQIHERVDLLVLAGLHQRTQDGGSRGEMYLVTQLRKIDGPNFSFLLPHAQWLSLFGRPRTNCGFHDCAHSSLKVGYLVLAAKNTSPPKSIVMFGEKSTDDYHSILFVNLGWPGCVRLY